MSSNQQNAFPYVDPTHNKGRPDPGISKREYFAIRAMQGILATNNDAWFSFEDAIPQLALMYADKLLDLLEKTKDK